jgi:transcriptional regulator with XRE-family HTH domain
LLREGREKKGLTVDQLAAITKLNPNFILALEEGRWDLLPGRVYLRSFARICAEALGIDVRDVYEKIDGFAPEEKKPDLIAPEIGTGEGKKRDYKLPLVLGVLVITVGLIIIFVGSGEDKSSDTESDLIVPARAMLRRVETRWDRPWQRPPADPDFFASNRLTLETGESEVRALVVADDDTVFQGTLPPESGKTFTADSAFRLSLSRNDKVAVYLNDSKMAEIGGRGGRLNNFLIAPEKKVTVVDEVE